MTYFDQGHALVIGVGADLPHTVVDAQGFARILKDPARCAYPPEQVALLTGKAADRAGILAALDALAAAAAAEATAVVYFSGHGYEVTTPFGKLYFLLPFGYVLDHPGDTAIGGQEFANKLRAIPAQKLLVLLDCCHAGGVGEAKAPGIETLTKAPLPPEVRALLREGRGRVLIASSRESELSYAGKPYSAFTLALIEALSGVGVAKQDGYARVADLALHTREVVPGRTQNRQHPILDFEHADNFVLAYYAGGDTQPKGTPFDVNAVEIEPEPGAWYVEGDVVAGNKTTVFDQRGQTVGTQTNIGGDVHGPLLSGRFDGPVAVGGGEAVDLRNSQNALYKPGGSVYQQFGDRVDVRGHGNVVGDHNVVGAVSVDEFLRVLTELRQAIPQAGLDPEEADAAVTDLNMVESQARKPKPNARMILSRIGNVAELLATADGAWGMLQRLQPLAQQLRTWAGQLFR